MKKLLLLPILFLSFVSVEAHKDLAPRVLEACTKYKWVRISANSPTVYTGKEHFCILPDENYYLIFDLYENSNSKYGSLIEQYSGIPPTFE